jgi:hypothetical protein
MPALPSAQNCVQVKLAGTMGTGKWNNVFYMQYTGTAPQVADLTTIGNGISTAWNTNIAPLAATTTQLSTIDLADLTSATASTLRAMAAVHVGTRTGTANPSNCTMVASWQYNLRYRGGHGRLYLPTGVTTDVTNGSQWTGAFVTLSLTSMRAFRTAINALTHGTTTYKLIVLSYFVNHALRPAPLPLTVNDVAIHGRVDTQRSRLGKETP